MHSITVLSDMLGAVRSATINSKALALAGVVVFSLAGAAQAGGPGGSYLQGAYADWDDADNGFNVGGSLMLGPSLRAFGDYTDTDLEQLRLGGGMVVPMASPLSLEVGGSYQRLEAGAFEDDGFGIHGIARFAATPEFTLAGKLEYVFRDDIDNELVFGFDGDYRFMPQLSAFVSYDIYDEIDDNLLMVGGRLHF